MLRAQSGQAAVEVVGVLPLALALTLGITQALLAGWSGELAGHAAEAAAIAVQRDGDATEAARDALPGWSEKRVTVTVEGRRVTVHLRPPSLLPPLGDALAADRSADAGPRR